MKRNAIHIVGGMVISILFCLGMAIGCSGCQNSPERKAHIATAAAITTARAALDVWFAHVNAEERALEQLKTSNPGEFMARRRKLVLDEGKVAGAWDTYIKAQSTFILGAAALGLGEAPTPGEAKRLESEFIALVQSLLR